MGNCLLVLLNDVVFQFNFLCSLQSTDSSGASEFWVLENDVESILEENWVYFSKEWRQACTQLVVAFLVLLLQITADPFSGKWLISDLLKLLGESWGSLTSEDEAAAILDEEEVEWWVPFETDWNFPLYFFFWNYDALCWGRSPCVRFRSHNRSSALVLCSPETNILTLFISKNFQNMPFSSTLSNRLIFKSLYEIFKLHFFLFCYKW